MAIIEHIKKSTPSGLGNEIISERITSADSIVRKQLLKKVIEIVNDEQIVVEELQKKDEMAWDRYVKTSDTATFFHQIAWREMVKDICGYTPLYFVVKREGSITGILPLFLVKSRISGKRLISLPYCGTGGICASNEESAKRLLNHAMRILSKEELEYIELRGGWLDDRRLILKDHYYTFRLDLQNGPEKLFRGFRKSMRKTIRKTLNHNFVVDYTRSEESIKAFYELHAADMKKFGTPVQSYTWIHQLIKRFPGNHTIARVSFEGTVIAMFIVREYKNTVSEIIGNDLPEYRHLCPNIFLQWKLIEKACEHGFRYYDFGRSIKESGTFFFKQGWGAVPSPMYHAYIMNKTENLPDTSQTNMKRKIFAAVWKHLPLFLINRIGPFIRRMYP